MPENEVRDEEYSATWSREQDWAFEKAVATYAEDLPDRWEKIAAKVPGKTVEEIKYHYELLVEDVERIESGLVPLPCYNSYSDGSTSRGGGDEGSRGKKGGGHGDGGKASKSELERRKGIAWSEEEHRQFLLGLEKYGKGDWRSISRNFVVTRTPTQVASHAQKYFIRLNSMNKDRRRSSIHDITNVNNGETATPQAPITGQTNGSSVGGGGSSGKPSKQPPPVSAPYSGGAAIGQPVGQPAVGTPVLPPPHMVYGVGAQVPGQVRPMTYPTPHTSAHR